MLMTLFPQGYLAHDLKFVFFLSCKHAYIIIINTFKLFKLDFLIFQLYEKLNKMVKCPSCLRNLLQWMKSKNVLIECPKMTTGNMMRKFNLICKVGRFSFFCKMSIFQSFLTETIYPT